MEHEERSYGKGKKEKNRRLILVFYCHCSCFLFVFFSPYFPLKTFSSKKEYSLIQKCHSSLFAEFFFRIAHNLMQNTPINWFVFLPAQVFQSFLFSWLVSYIFLKAVLVYAMLLASEENSYKQSEAWVFFTIGILQNSLHFTSLVVLDSCSWTNKGGGAALENIALLEPTTELTTYFNLFLTLSS